MADSFNYKKDFSDTHFEQYDGKMVLKSNDPKTQDIFNKILSVFDENKNQKLDAKEIQTIWQNVKSADKNEDDTITVKELEAYIKKNKILSKLNLNAEDILKFIKITDNTIDKSFARTKAKTEQSLLEELKKKYPSDKYEVSFTTQNENISTISVKDKKSGNTILRGIVNENGSYNYTIMDKEAYFFNKNGQLEMYSKLDDNNVWQNGDPISDAIYKDITAKTSLGLPTTGKDIEKHIKLITPDNILQVFSNYQGNYEETLLEAIEGEWGLDDKVKEKLKQHLNKCLLQSNVWKYNKPNTKIDKKIFQGKIGDCWFLSSIAAAAVKPKGLKILNDTIKENPDGTYTVKFKGADKAYTVTPLEIFSASDYEEGDWDARILEIAAQKHFNILGIEYGGQPSTALDLVLGTSYSQWKDFLSFINPFDSNTDEDLRKIIKDPNTVVTTGINPILRLGIAFEGNLKDKEYEEEISWAHAYAVVDMDNKYVYLKNPWHTGDPTKKHTEETFKMPIEEFKKHLMDITYVRLD